MRQAVGFEKERVMTVFPSVMDTVAFIRTCLDYAPHITFRDFALQPTVSVKIRNFLLVPVSKKSAADGIMAGLRA